MFAHISGYEYEYEYEYKSLHKSYHAWSMVWAVRNCASSANVWSYIVCVCVSDCASVGIARACLSSETEYS